MGAVHYIKRTFLTNRLAESLLYNFTKGKSTGHFFTRIPLNNEQYKKGSIRHCMRKGIKYELDISQYDDYIIYFGMDNEPKDHIYELSKGANVILDIGINIGETVLTLAKINPHAKVHGFEPVPQTFKRVKKNVELNPFSNIILHNLAVSEEEGMVYFNYDENSHHSGGVKMHADEALEHKAKCTSIDAFTKDQNLDRLDFIKIDVEGLELKVLKGGMESIKKFKPKMVIEISAAFLEENRELFGLLKEMGYQFYNTGLEEINEESFALSNDHVDILAIV